MQNREWQQVKEDLINKIDNLGERIDSGILDVVVGLNFQSVHTIASCEGHLDWGIAGPWIDIEVKNENKESVALKKQLENMHKQIRDEKSNLNEKEAIILANQIRQLEKKIRKPYLQERLKVMKLLREFYQDRLVDYPTQLHLIEYDFAMTRLENIGANLQEILPVTERKKNLKAFQQEMLAFGAFLKNKKIRLVDAFCNHKIEFSVNLQLLQNFFTDWQLTPSFA